MIWWLSPTCRSIYIGNRDSWWKKIRLSSRSFQYEIPKKNMDKSKIATPEKKTWNQKVFNASFLLVLAFWNWNDMTNRACAFHAEVFHFWCYFFFVFIRFVSFFPDLSMSPLRNWFATHTEQIRFHRKVLHQHVFHTP